MQYSDSDKASFFTDTLDFDGNSVPGIFQTWDSLDDDEGVTVQAFVSDSTTINEDSVVKFNAVSYYIGGIYNMGNGLLRLSLKEIVVS